MRERRAEGEEGSEREKGGRGGREGGREVGTEKESAVRSREMIVFLLN